jgi:hypothetical protein
MRAMERALCGLAWAAVVAFAAADAEAYTARVRWQPSPDAGVTGYKIYRRTLGGIYATGQDVGEPAAGGDGTITVQVTSLDVRTDYAFAVTAYTASASESGLSNELLLGYAQVASLFDSDGDGLTDAQEDLNLNRVVDPGESDPSRLDSDNDGVRDQPDACEWTVAGTSVNAAGCSCAQIPGCVPCSTASQCGDGDPCTIDTCSDGACQHGPAPNGGSCSDGNACNGAETCQGGICRPGTPLTCSDGNACTTDSCSPASGCVFAPNTNPCGDDGNRCTADVCSGGSCTHPPVADGTLCPDATVCNGEETCQAGTCRPGLTLDCNDGNACTTDSCGATTGCAHAPIPGCAACTSASQCGDGNPCTADACVGGTCTYTPVANGASCNDTNACNGTETCQSGTCRAGTPLACNDGNACTTDTCSPAVGCVFTANTSPCADDGNVCTNDVCGGGSCTHPPKANGLACGDGNLCNGTETCQAGSCAAGSPLACSDDDACTTDSCSPTGGCVFTRITGCTGCASAAQCNDADPCTVDTCSSGVCGHGPAATGTSCSDGNLCNGLETCQAGTCRPGTTLNCSDTNPCTTDTCDAASGCRRTNNTNPCADEGNRCTDDVCAGGSCTHPAKANGASCSDGNACDGAEICQNGSCQNGLPPVCNDSNPCTNDSCNPTTGCVFTNNTATCGDDGNFCTADVCGGGRCTHPPKAEGATCSDGLYCTIADSCRSGVCTGGVPNCTAFATACKTAACDETRRACTTAPKPMGTSCADTNACNGEETCRAGSCMPGRAPNCDDGNPCTTDRCDPAVGCTHTSVTDGTACGDDKFCNGAETCQAGACVPPPILPCADTSACTTDDCDEAHNRCSHESIPDCCVEDADCADADACTVAERCEAGQCVSDPLACPAPEGPCEQGACDPESGCTTLEKPDGSACEDGDPCTRNEECSAGACRIPLFGTVAAAPPPRGNLVVTKFVMKTTKKGIQLTASASFLWGVFLDPTVSGVRLEIRSETQTASLYEVEVPGPAFAVNGTHTRFLAVPRGAEAAAYGGLKRLALRSTGAGMDVSLKAVLPLSASDAVARTAAIRGTAGDSIAWAIWFGADCVSDPDLSCQGNKSRSRKCR